ncbi:hypothetical protein OSB04_004978 [Centaurea solstitialis]|uniref:Lon N-terminal domain-containing protein n=1 Tax=Centaurea solstitialis TaxID=347529 RepID=A0AA38TMQ0_9ASTR|nr:hypothetical protein OSB04_004978 [Centaurea solstitialis]
MSCRTTTLNAFTTNTASTSSIAVVNPSSLLISNISPNSFLAIGNGRIRRRIGGGSSITNPNFRNHVVGGGNKKLLGCSFVAYAGFLELPLLPFPSEQVLVPSEAKTLHLFEARYLKLLDESLFKKKKLFVHFVLDPIVVSSMSKEASFAAKYGCLVAIEKVEQLDVGALVSIRGIGRVTLVKFAKVEPFLEGIVLPLQDNVPQNASEISSKVQELKEALHGLNSLEIKLKARKDEPLQTQTANSLEWALQEPFLDCEEAFIPSFAERVSFAGLQNLSGSTQSEMTELQNEKLKAMDVKACLADKDAKALRCQKLLVEEDEAAQRRVTLRVLVVLVLSEAKTLHLFEARYLKLLDESLFKKKKLFVHFVLDPIVVSSMSKEASFAAKYGCLVAIEKVEQLDVGALVSIRGIGRVTLVKFAKVEPFLEGIVLPLQDNVPQNASEISSKVQELKEALHGLNSLEIKLKARKDEPLQTQTANSLEWALQEPFLGCEEAFIPSFAERVSFAGLQNLSGSTQSEMTELQNEKLKAMDVKETLERVENCLSFIKNRVSMTAAKLAIQSLNMQ